MALAATLSSILAEGLTFVNLVGNCLGAIVVARWEGALDQSKITKLNRFDLPSG